MSEISQVFDADDMFTPDRLFQRSSDRKQNSFRPENKLFENEMVTVLSIKTWKHQNASSKNRASRPEAVWLR